MHVILTVLVLFATSLEGVCSPPHACISDKQPHDCFLLFSLLRGLHADAGQSAGVHLSKSNQMPARIRQTHTAWAWLQQSLFAQTSATGSVKPSSLRQMAARGPSTLPKILRAGSCLKAWSASLKGASRPPVLKILSGWKLSGTAGTRCPVSGQLQLIS